MSLKEIYDKQPDTFKFSDENSVFCLLFFVRLDFSVPMKS